MNKRFLAVLAFALVVSLAASTVVYRLIVGRMTAQAETPAQQVLVAARDLEVGALLKTEDLKLVEWKGPLGAQFITKMPDALGRGVIANIYSGEPILLTRLASTGAGAGLAATIPTGMRAAAVRVNEVVGLAGFVVPGLRVDVIVSGTPPGDSRALGTITRTVLQNIQVLSAGQNIQKDEEGKPVTVQVVNLLVTPEQAEVLSLASTEAHIQLVLRNPLDTLETKPAGTASALLFRDRPTGLPAERSTAPARAVFAAAPPKPKPPVMELVIVPIQMEVINGPKREMARVGQTVEERVKTDDKRKGEVAQ